MYAKHYFGSGDEDIKKMLERIGFSDLMELYRYSIGTDKVKIHQEPLDLPPALSEEEAKEYMEKVAQLNKMLTIFAGGGAYDTFVPSAINHIILRSEYYTAYTPYQPEVSQGTLQTMFEFQSLITELTDMEVANASVYDGATALAEAVLMSFRIAKKYKVLLPENLNPAYRRVVETYLQGIDATIESIPFDKNGRIDEEALASLIDEETASVVIQHPNYFGILEDPFRISALVKEKGKLLISVFEPTSLAILEPPGRYDADIAVAEGQPLGVPLFFGGPYVGLFTSKKKYIRQLPGRIVAVTYDEKGRRGYVTTLQTREQHIRRAKATSNICTNQQLIATMVTIYLTLMGKEGLKEAALQSFYKAEYLKEKLSEIGLEPAFRTPTFREFVVKTPMKAEEFIHEMAHRGFLVGPKVEVLGDNYLLMAATEKRRKEEIDALIEAVKEVV